MPHASDFQWCSREGNRTSSSHAVLLQIAHWHRLGQLSGEAGKGLHLSAAGRAGEGQLHAHTQLGGGWERRTRWRGGGWAWGCPANLSYNRYAALLEAQRLLTVQSLCPGSKQRRQSILWFSGQFLPGRLSHETSHYGYKMQENDNWHRFTGCLQCTQWGGCVWKKDLNSKASLNFKLFKF